MLKNSRSLRAAALWLLCVLAFVLTACGGGAAASAEQQDAGATSFQEAVSDVSAAGSDAAATGAGSDAASATDTGSDAAGGFIASTVTQQTAPVSEGPKPEEPVSADADQLYSELNITQDIREDLIHGQKGAEYQKWIVLHDTESWSDASSVVEYWEGAGTYVAAHFIVNTDGSIVQCVPMDSIAHHAGFGDAGHNALFGVEDESRDDRRGTEPIGDWAPDYGMNSYSVGIELVHASDSGEGYPEEQLAALDKLIAYIDAYYGFESQITDHKAWRSGNSDTSEAFATYLANYQDHRTHM